jgi:anaerobic magnesium-protoporphyrin IX monomethyl ester cyclase
MFDDDTIHVDKKWFREFFDLYKRQVHIPFKCNIRPDIIDEEIVDLLKDAGVARVNIGVEHGNEEFRRKYLKRDMTNRQIIEAFDLFRRRNIGCYAHLMVGLPYENKRLFLDTVSLCRELPILPSNPIFIFNPYPATELGDLCEEKGWLLPKKHYREREDSITNYPFFKKEEIKLCKDAFSLLLTLRFLPPTLTVLTVCGLTHRLSNYLKARSSLFSKVLNRLKSVFQPRNESRPCREMRGNNT